MRTAALFLPVTRPRRATMNISKQFSFRNMFSAFTSSSVSAIKSRTTSTRSRVVLRSSQGLRCSDSERVMRPRQLLACEEFRKVDFATDTCRTRSELLSRACLRFERSRLRCRERRNPFLLFFSLYKRLCSRCIYPRSSSFSPSSFSIACHGPGGYGSIANRQTILSDRDLECWSRKMTQLPSHPVVVQDLCSLASDFSRITDIFC